MKRELIKQNQDDCKIYEPTEYTKSVGLDSVKNDEYYIPLALCIYSEICKHRGGGGKRMSGTGTRACILFAWPLPKVSEEEKEHMYKEYNVNICRILSVWAGSSDVGIILLMCMVLRSTLRRFHAMEGCGNTSFHT